MSRLFRGFIDELSKKSGYSYEFLADMYDEIVDEEGDIDMDYFVGVTMERDW